MVTLCREMVIHIQWTEQRSILIINLDLHTITQLFTMMQRLITAKCDPSGLCLSLQDAYIMMLCL